MGSIITIFIIHTLPTCRFEVPVSSSTLFRKKKKKKKKVDAFCVCIKFVCGDSLTHSPCRWEHSWLYNSAALEALPAKYRLLRILKIC